MGNTGVEVDKVEKQKRIYEISLLLRKKSVNYILQFVAQNWGLRNRQAYNYIRLAREEWQKYFAKLKTDGMSYHAAQLRDLKDTAYDKEDYRLVFDIAKEEAKLMGIYPAEKHKMEEERKVIVIGRAKEEKGNAMERLFFEINNLVEKRIEVGDKYRGKYKEIDDNGVDQRSEAQKLADRLIVCRGSD